MSYNPADYKAVEGTAKDMTKPELEKCYVKDRDCRHFNCVEVIGVIIAVIGAILLIGFIGYAMAETDMENKVSNNIREVTEDVCPTLGSGYISDKFFASSYRTNRIICNEVNSVPR